MSNQPYTEFRYQKRRNDMTPEELVEYLESELKRVKIQRNNYEQQVFSLQTENRNLKNTVEWLESYINNRKTDM